MAENLIPGEEHNTPPPSPKAKLTCEFCGCQLTPVGDVLRMSDAARDFSRQAEQIRDLKTQLTTVRSDCDTATRELGEARTRIAQLTEDEDDDDDD